MAKDLLFRTIPQLLDRQLAKELNNVTMKEKIVQTVFGKKLSSAREG